jgi:hypothetical protein
MKNTSQPARSSRLSWLLVPVPPFLLVMIGVLLFVSTGRDDSHISYWPAHTLAHFGEIANHSGEPIEQSSSLLFVLILALAIRVSEAPAPSLGPLVSVFFGVLSIFATQRLVAVIVPRISLAAAFIISTSVYVIYWSFSGMEATLTAFTGTWLLLSFLAYLNKGYSHLRGVSVWAATACFLLVRPESFLVVFCLLLGAGAVALFKRSVIDREHAEPYGIWNKRILFLFGSTVILFLGLVLFRSLYFGSFMPQPVLAKSAGLSLDHIKEGLKYTSLSLSIFYVEPFVLLVAINTLHVGYCLRQRDGSLPPDLLPTLFVLASTSFIILAGGDWMEGGRFFVHMWPVTTALSVLALHRLITTLVLPEYRTRVFVTTVAFLCLVQLPGALVFMKKESTSIPIWDRMRQGRFLLPPSAPIPAEFSWSERANFVHLRDAPTIVHLRTIVGAIRASKEEGPVTLMSNQMGVVAYYLALTYYGDLQFTDVFGLSDRRLTSCPITANFPRTFLGLDMRIERYLKNRERFTEECGISPPDVIYDLPHNVSPEELSSHGYVVIYEQTGSLSTASTPENDAGQLIAIREDLFDALGMGPDDIVRLDLEP